MTAELIVHDEAAVIDGYGRTIRDLWIHPCDCHDRHPNPLVLIPFPDLQPATEVGK